jgi:hypothetical protein
MNTDRKVIVLFPGQSGDVETGEGWMPRVALDHDEGSELYVVVGEEVGGMVEGVSAPTFEAIRRHVLATDTTGQPLADRLKDLIDRSRHEGLEQVDALRTHYAKIHVDIDEIGALGAAYMQGVPDHVLARALSFASRMYELGYEAGRVRP